MNFAGVILAGGQSSRMGRDKAWLSLNGQPLLTRQIALLREAGADEILISGRRETDYSEFGCRVIVDERPGLGPLGGIAAALEVIAQPMLIVLAVDMPNVTAGLLAQLVTRCANGDGVIPRHGDFIEPLAAIYPQVSAPLAQRLLAHTPRGNAPGAKDFAQGCVTSGLARFWELAPDAAPWFDNWNSSGDVPGVN